MIVLADKAYDVDRIRRLIEEHGATPNIPGKSNRKWKPCFSKRPYRERNLIERFFSKLKHFRRVATRYDKLAANFLAMVQIASMRLAPRLRVYGLGWCSPCEGCKAFLQIPTFTNQFVGLYVGRKAKIQKLYIFFSILFIEMAEREGAV